MIPLFVKIKPGSFKDEIAFDKEDNLIIKIREKPIDGAANDYLIKFLSKELKRKVRIIAGLKSKEKLIEVI